MSNWKREILKALEAKKINSTEAVFLLKRIDKMEVRWLASAEPEHKKFNDLFHKVAGITPIEWVST